MSYAKLLSIISRTFGSFFFANIVCVCMSFANALGLCSTRAYVFSMLSMLDRRPTFVAMGFQKAPVGLGTTFPSAPDVASEKAVSVCFDQYLLKGGIWSPYQGAITKPPTSAPFGGSGQNIRI